MITKPVLLLLTGTLVAPRLHLGPGPVRPSETRDPIVGHWRGASTCVRADWNASCHDEQVVYECERSPADSSRVVMHASKIVDDKLVPMGDVGLVFQDSTDAWVGDVTTPRFHLSWQFQVDGNDLTGRLVVLPSNRVARHVKASRG